MPAPSEVVAALVALVAVAAVELDEGDLLTLCDACHLAVHGEHDARDIEAAGEILVLYGGV